MATDKGLEDVPEGKFLPPLASYSIIIFKSLFLRFCATLPPKNAPPPTDFGGAICAPAPSRLTTLQQWDRMTSWLTCDTKHRSD